VLQNLDTNQVVVLKDRLTEEEVETGTEEEVEIEDLAEQKKDKQELLNYITFAPLFEKVNL